MSKLAINGGEPLRTEPFTGWPPDDPGFLQRLQQVLDSGAWGGHAEHGKEFCEEFAAFHDAEYAIAITNGTQAIQLCLYVLGVGPGDEVIVPPYTFVGTAQAVIAANAVPRFADIEPDTFCLDPEDVKAKINDSTAAVIPVHIGGMPCNMAALQEICAEHDLRLVEDACQAHGAEYDGTKVGAIGDMGAFSLQASKNVCAGEGGVVLTNDRALYETGWRFVNCGRIMGGAWYDHRTYGYNMRLSAFQSAVALRGLELLPGHMDIRDENAAHLRQRLSPIDGVAAQAFPDGATRSAYHMFAFRYDSATVGVSRDRFIEVLSAEGIPVGKGYNPLYRERMFTEDLDMGSFPFVSQYYQGSIDYTQTHCPVCEHVCEDGSFFMGQSSLLGTTKDMDATADAIEKVIEHKDEIP